ncbi:hypothetical protein [Streptomyces mirabilis]
MDPPPGAEGVLPLLAPMLAVIGPPPGPKTEAEYALRPPLPMSLAGVEV